MKYPEALLPKACSCCPGAEYVKWSQPWIKEAFDKAGLIYGMGHAVYSLSDPRAELFRSFVERLSKEKGRKEEFDLYSTVERLAPQIIAKERKIYKGVSPNVDFFSGFAYSMLNLPLELYTPIFAIARILDKAGFIERFFMKKGGQISADFFFVLPVVEMLLHIFEHFYHFDVGAGLPTVC